MQREDDLKPSSSVALLDKTMYTAESDWFERKNLRNWLVAGGVPALLFGAVAFKFRRGLSPYFFLTSGACFLAASHLLYRGMVKVTVFEFVRAMGKQQFPRSTFAEYACPCLDANSNWKSFTDILTKDPIMSSMLDLPRPMRRQLRRACTSYICRVRGLNDYESTTKYHELRKQQQQQQQQQSSNSNTQA
eukprot:TRINITY_DN355_c5_g1_i1.p1 TRINITY_DN355_c5_g1~~TRINITY_DN355_c5_g1_i1.p1  ORF type:complete len:190 (-),score=42.58 TRINITY_DN355_c5_g1_i1:473-1042(-)